MPRLSGALFCYFLHEENLKSQLEKRRVTKLNYNSFLPTPQTASSLLYLRFPKEIKKTASVLVLLKHILRHITGFLFRT
jgi:hypothetical protein